MTNIIELTIKKFIPEQLTPNLVPIVLAMDPDENKFRTLNPAIK